MVRFLGTGLLALAVLLDLAPGQAPPTQTPPTATGAPIPQPEEPGEPWTFAASVYTYVVPDDREYVQPTVTADRDWLHLEARYNYEALDTGSAFVGYNFSAGTELELEMTLMLGGVFGDTTGVAPGYRGSLSWWKLELFSEGEYVFDTRDAWDSFFYNWSELTVAPADWFRFGVVTQRTRLYETDREIQRGLVLGISTDNLDFTGYVFNPDDAKPTFVFSLGFSF